MNRRHLNRRYLNKIYKIPTRIIFFHSLHPLALLILIFFYTLTAFTNDTSKSEKSDPSKTLILNAKDPQKELNPQFNTNMTNDDALNTSSNKIETVPPVRILTDPKVRRATTLDWDPIDQAKTYELEINPINVTVKSTSTSTPFLFTITTPSWTGDLSPGKYSMRLRSKDRRDVPGEWSPLVEFYVKLYAPTPLFPLSNQEIITKEAETTELTFKWIYQSEASNYKIHIEDKTSTFSQNLELKATEVKVKLPVAREYNWTIIGYDSQGNEADLLNETINFKIIGNRLEIPKIKVPDSPYVRQLQWESIPFAESYKINLMRKENEKKWKNILNTEQKNTVIAFDSAWKGGEYKLSITALGNLRTNSKTRSIIFKVINGDRSIAAEKKAGLRKSIDRTVDWYLVASYLITKIQYSAKNVDYGTGPSTRAIGGTGRLGAGYLDYNSPFGFLGIIDLSGFIIGNKNYTYPGLEVHGIYRWMSGDLGEIRLSGGVFYKEIPEILGNANSGTYSVSQLGALGIHSGGEYWYALNSKLGIQLNGRVYYPLKGKTPNHKSLIPTASYQFGFMGSLRLNPKATGLIGYAYRKDELNYQAENTTALSAGYSNNRTSVVGHYLNFLIEWDY